MSQTLRTKICESLNIKYPVIQAGMAGGHTTPELVGAVSDAGGLGILAASRLTPEQLREAIHKTQSLTNRPFGVNLLLAPPESGNQDVATVQGFLIISVRNLGYRLHLQIQNAVMHLI